MADKTMLNFRCPADLLEAIDALGQQRYPSETAKHGCDRSKTLLDIVRAGIEALSNGVIVLPVPDEIVRQNQTTSKTLRKTLRKTEDAIDIEARLAAVEERLGKLKA